MKWILFFFGGFVFNSTKNGISDHLISLEKILTDTDINKNTNKNNTKSGGYDDRFQDNHDVDYKNLNQIRINIQRKSLLDMLQNNKISEKEKELAAINYLDENKLSKYAPDLFSGGLLDDWT